MSNTLSLNTLSALFLSFLLIAFHLVTFSIFTPGLSFFNDLLSSESRIEFSLELKKNYWYILKYLVPILVNLCLSFSVISIHIQLNLTINVGSIVYICFFPWATYYCIAIIISLFAMKDISWQNLSQLFLIKDIILIFSNAMLTVIGGILAYLFNLVFSQ